MQWSDSKWRSLKIQWDEPATIQRPDRVSAWEIEPFVASSSLDLSPPALKSKRPRPVDHPLSEATTYSAASPFRYQGSTTSLEVSHLSNNVEIHKNVIERSTLTDYASPPLSRASNCHVLNQEKGKKPETSTGCRLFGIDLRNNSNNLPPPKKEVAGSNIVSKSGPTGDALEADNAPKTEQSLEEKNLVQLEETSTKEVQNKQGCTTSTRTRTKVHMQGVAVGRAVDLTVVEGYEDLINELEKMFEIKGELHTRKKWEVVYTDAEGDMMLVGDDPWQEFCGMVKKIFIYTSEEVKKMSTRFKLPVSSLEGEGTTASLVSELKSED